MPKLDWLKEENWFYCCLCDEVSYKFDCCGKTTCGGSSCDICKYKYYEIKALILQGKCPRYEKLTKKSTKEDLDKLFKTD